MSGRTQLRRALPAALLPLSLVLAACGSSVGGAEEAEGDDLKIGFIVPATGLASATGLAMQAGFELAVERINADGGVNGQDVTYEIQDDAGDPATTSQIARRYSQDNAVDMLFGTITGDTAAAVQPIADEAGMPFATAILGDPPVCSPYAWPFGESSRQLLAIQVANLMEDYGPRIAFVGSDYNFPRDYAEAAKELIEANGGELIAEEYSPLGTTDFESTIGRLSAAQPDAILAMVVGSDAVTFTLQGAQFGLLTPEMGYEGAPLDSDYFGAVSAVTTGREHVVRWADGLEDEDSQAFVEDYVEETGLQVPVSEVAANAYYAMLFIAGAINDSGAGTREEINEALAGFSFDSPLGEGTRFVDTEGGGHLFQADMLTATVTEDGYAVAEDHGVVDDVTVSCQ
ncbi:ABC transporter substrate-binding protein [Blastococcus haudaquaticus]|uniref:ABC transporter substrate-binding protein n=1 Tax=Blastococcus haudaquaticus TaxID=1938745 RepID=UPI001359BDEA|nr:ABC transporter substrate-binding protein [Blastococcus haudaquaticus]